MSQTFFFYDLETTGLNPRQDRIMQFAGQRTSNTFEPLGQAYNILVKLNDDTLPSPDALLVTGITPQQTQADGITEAAFAHLLSNEIFTNDTVIVGYNNIRFDDEFIRTLFWRNFIDPYEWSWRDGRSRWDMLDVVRMTRALRPDGINWPVVDGKEVNKLELLSQLNGVNHTKAHDALSDVEALIGVTRLIKEKQPQLYNHLFSIRDKKKVADIVNLDDKKPFVYVSGQYEEVYHKATVAFPLTAGRNGNVVVYDLRYDPTPLLQLSTEALTKQLYATKEEREKPGYTKIPVKELQYNRAPAVAPLGVLGREDGWHRIELSVETIKKHQEQLLSSPTFAENIRSIFETRPEFEKDMDVEAKLYDGFVPDSDRLLIQKVSQASAKTLTDLHPLFSDERLGELLLHYKARNFPISLAEDEAALWEQWRSTRIKKQLPRFMERLGQLATIHYGDASKEFILQELQLWAESIAPFDN